MRARRRFAIGGIKAAVLPKGTRGAAVRATLTLRFGDEKSLFGLGEVPETVAALLDKGTKTLTSRADPGPTRPAEDRPVDQQRARVTSR